MESLGQLSVIERVEARIQNEIADFLKLKSVINRLRNHGSVTIRSKAEGLYVSQISLEGELASVLESIKKAKAGAWTFGTVAEATDFAARVIEHKRKVKDLEREAGGTVVERVEGAGLNLPLIGLGIGAVMLLWWNR